MASNCKLFTVILLLVFNSVTSTKDKDSLLTVPEKCKDQRYCSIKPEGYDKLEEKMKKALPSFLIKEYSDRYSSEEDIIKDPFPETNLDNCQYEVKMEQMYTYYHGANNTKTEIIIQTDLFKQLVKTVHCIYPSTDDIDNDVQCFKKLLKKPHNKKSRCEPSNAKRTLYVYDVMKDEIVAKYFEVPACCSCQVTYTT